MRKRYKSSLSEAVKDEESNIEEKKEPKCEHGISLLYAVLLLGALLGLYGIVYLIDGSLPTALRESDEQDYPNEFIAERARRNLRVLTEMGGRESGSKQNEYYTVNFFKYHINKIIDEKHDNQEIEYDVQVVSDAFFLNDQSYGYINAYANIQNVVVRLSSKSNSKSSVLLNAHFDAVPTSPGGTDDGLSCTVMLEILRKLSKESERPEHNIIFLFNGAEELGLYGAHGFISHHKWASEVIVFMNLEGAGSGGKEILFQSGPSRPWLMKYYNQVPHPFAQAAGEEVFQNNLIPSDTDFRILRDHGHAIGYDMAFARNSYRYHTKFDGLESIPSGSIQHMGANALSLVRSLANAPELENPRGQSEGKTVFYDFFGLFMVCYTETIAVVVNVIITIVSVLLALKSFKDFGLGCSWKSAKHLSLSAGVILLGWVAAAIFVIIIAVILDAVNYTMSWYRNPWIIFGLYVTPTIAFLCLFIISFRGLLNKNGLLPDAQAQIELHIIRLVWSLILFIGTCLRIRSMYIIFVPVTHFSFIFLFIQIFGLQQTTKPWRIVYLFGTIIPTMFVMYLSLTIITIFIPTMGRGGSDSNPEIFIGILTLFLTILITSTFVPFLALVRKPISFLVGLCAIFILFLIFVFTSVGFPYSGDDTAPAPQRVWIYHTARIFHNESGHVRRHDGGFLLLNHDRNSPNILKNYVPEINDATSLDEDCTNELFCGLPLANYRMFDIPRLITWIPAEEPSVHQAVGLQLLSKENLYKTIIRYNFSVTGPDRMGVYISPRVNTELQNINTGSENNQLDNKQQWNNRSMYLIYYMYGKTQAPLQFTVDVKVPTNWDGPTIDVAVTGKYVHEDINNKTTQYKKFLSKFPEWAAVCSWIGVYESWVF